MRPAFFGSVDGDPRRLVPAPHANGPWQPNTLHGRLLGGLLMREVEQGHTDDDFGCTRLTVDLFRSFPLAPIAVRSHRIRDGRRIRVVLAEIESAEPGPDGEPVVIAQATAVLLRRGEQPVQDLLPTRRWTAPPASALPLVAAPGSALGSAPGSATWDSWRIPVEPDWGMNAQNGLWLREIHHLVDDELPSAAVRAGLAADLVSSSTAGTPQGLSFINADFTIYFGRPPFGEIVGIEPTGHLSAQGRAAGQAVFHDETGPFGFLGVTAVANRLMPGRPAPH